MNKIIYPLSVVVFFKFNISLAQDESLVPLKNNPTLINEWKRINSGGVHQNDRIQSSTNDTLLLPFIDDFSGQYMFPRPDLWKDSAVFINADFPVNPPTIGVATFDGLNRFGNPYVATATSDGSCDTLTSKPINAYDDGQGNPPYDPAAGLFFSFFYEKKGLGDSPETNDHLDLEFFNPVSNTWSSPVWSVVGGGPSAADTTFTRVQITITDLNYFHKGFRFRFRNIGSRTGNIDHWHIDYVTLKAPPNLSNINDVAYVTPGHSLLAGMTAMPYTHYTFGTSQSALMANNLTCKMFNNNDTFDKICRFVDRIYDPSGTEIFCNGCPIGSNNFQIDHQNSLNYNFPFASFTYPSLPQTTAAFDVVNNIESTSGGGQLDDNANNDTIHYLQKFYNYYSYDDGTAELGYNLNVAGAQLALKFHLYKADVLHAVQFYFTQIGPSVSNQLFNIVLWNDAGGVPGTVLCQKFNQIPAYSNIIDGFVTYNFPTCSSTLPVGDYYIGFIQAGSTGLNLGFDANIVTPPSLKYYKTTGSWTQSNFAGSWMIRPVFSPYPFNVGEKEIDPLNTLSIYPNPASQFIHIDYDFKEKSFYELYDASGRIVAGNRLLNNTIDVQNISDGFYVLKIADDEKKNIFQQKVIVHH